MGWGTSHHHHHALRKPLQPAGPSAALRLLEVQVLEGEVSFHDARSLHPGAQNILLSRDVGRLRYSIQVVQVTKPEETTPDVLFLVHRLAMNLLLIAEQSQCGIYSPLSQHRPRTCKQTPWGLILWGFGVF